MTAFLERACQVFPAFLPLFFLGAGGWVLTRTRILTREGVHQLSGAVVYFTLPCLIFAKFARHFRPETFPDWWLLPVVSFLILFLAFLLALGVGWLLKMERRRVFLALVTFQNAGYVALAVGATLPLLAAPERQSAWVLYIFLLLIVQSPLLWTFNLWLHRTGGSGAAPAADGRRLPPPPFLAVTVSLVLALLGIKLPAIAVDTLDLAGQATVPLILIVTGGVLALAAAEKRAVSWKFTLAAAGLKLLAVPAAALGLLLLGGGTAWLPAGFDYAAVLALLLVVEAGSPPALGHVVVAQRFGGDPALVSRHILVTYLAALVTLPFWISLFLTLFPA